MVEAIVGVALRAILASVLLGGLLAGVVLVATRTLALTAATRHALWITALVATAVMPLAGIAVSLSRAAPTPTETLATMSTVSPILPEKRATAATHGGGASSAVSRPASRHVASSDGGPRAERGGRAAWGGAPFNTPRVSRALALGVVAIWLAGALIGLLGLAASIVRVRGLKRRSSPLDGALAEELPWLTEVDRGREIYLRLSFETETPVAVGFRRPVILIPTELATADGLSAIEQLILHEHAHLRRYDDWTNLVQRTIERLFWFNPIVWLVGRRIALEREIASDDDVVAKTGEAHAYATSLWKLAREMRMPEHAVVAPGALLTRKQITIRIEQLLDKNRARLHRSPAAALGVGLAGMLAVAFVATSAPAVELPAEPLAAASAAPAAVSPAAVVKQTHAQPQKPTHTAVVEQHLVRVAQSVGAARALPMSPLAAVRSLPPLPVVPAVPAVPAVPRVHPETQRTVVETQGIRVDVSRVLHDVMTSLPSEIAQASSTPSKHTAYDGVKLSRELVASCVGCSFRNADVRGLDLHGLRINAADFTGADMRGVNLAGAKLLGASLARANLSNADLRDALLTGVELRGAVFDGAQLDGIKLVGVSIRDVSLRGTMLRSVLASCTGCDFAKLDLHGQDLHGITLTGADMSRTDLHDANLSGVHFVGVDLSHANLAGADLTNARFEGCDLSGIDLHGAHTTGMTMQGSDLGG